MPTSPRLLRDVDKFRGPMWASAPASTNFWIVNGFTLPFLEAFVSFKTMLQVFYAACEGQGAIEKYLSPIQQASGRKPG